MLEPLLAKVTAPRIVAVIMIVASVVVIVWALLERFVKPVANSSFPMISMSSPKTFVITAKSIKAVILKFLENVAIMVTIYFFFCRELSPF